MKSFLLLFSLIFSLHAFAADSYEKLEVGSDVFHRVVVLSANESSLSIRHARGIAQVPLSKLSPELQAKYGYDSARAADREAELAAQRQRQIQAQEQRIAAAKAVQARELRSQARAVAPSPAGSSSAFSLFGTEPQLKTEVDLRDRFRSHGIRVRSQSGPSCSVHAIVAALEYQFAEGHGQALNLSEPYLINATSRSLGRPDAVGFDRETGRRNGLDLGFALEHVFQAIRGHGLALEQTREERAAKTPYSMLDTVNFSPFMVPGARSEKGIQNIVHVLNANMPVVVGVSWPAYSRIAHTSVLSKQPVRPDGGHAVTIIGYRCEDGKIENAKFIFRNSWGDDWGAGGYGFFTYEYLLNNLNSCYVVELK
ncbi:C1 family peptidase [Pelagicoccus sp. SDUM812005]|uniref:C1 family peptidase n=1 Tax=Pelagicoccus sp. SDUM812005 TaxID=3041257 RepID=UPI00280FDDD5|nr:C1 family peptidase [Pelagicoccus sp. SDUM812005]MDQ8183185.1 C1 family peptidase [Pelagicoccus sp. SDUM812005]